MDARSGRDTWRRAKAWWACRGKANAATGASARRRRTRGRRRRLLRLAGSSLLTLSGQSPGWGGGVSGGSEPERRPHASRLQELPEPLAGLQLLRDHQPAEVAPAEVLRSGPGQGVIDQLEGPGGAHVHQSGRPWTITRHWAMTCPGKVLEKSPEKQSFQGRRRFVELLTSGTGPGVRLRGGGLALPNHLQNAVIPSLLWLPGNRGGPQRCPSKRSLTRSQRRRLPGSAAPGIFTPALERTRPAFPEAASRGGGLRVLVLDWGGGVRPHPPTLGCTIRTVPENTSHPSESRWDVCLSSLPRPRLQACPTVASAADPPPPDPPASSSPCLLSCKCSHL